MLHIERHIIIAKINCIFHVGVVASMFGLLDNEQYNIIKQILNDNDVM